MQDHNRQQVGERKQGRYISKSHGESTGEWPGNKSNATNDLRHEEMVITRNDPPAPSTGTGIGTVGSQASKGSGKYRDKGGTIMIKRALPTNNDGSAHHLGKIMAGSTGSQQGEIP
jgi:hypothetical protein